MLRLSFSQLKLFKSYPLDYFYRYILKLPEKNNETKWADFGKGVHEVLEDYYSGKNKDYYSNAKEKWDFYKLEGRMNYSDFKKNIINGISLNWYSTNLEEEIKLDIFGDVSFVGYLDVLDKDNHIILDWKTGTYTKDKENDYKAQLLCYAWMYYKKYNVIPKSCHLFFTKQSKLVDFSFTLEQINKFEIWVKKTAKEILYKKENHFKPDEWGNELNFFSGYHYLNNLEELVFNIDIKNNFCYLSGSISPLLLNGLKKEFAVDDANKFFIQKQVREKYGEIKNIDDIGTKYLFDTKYKKFSLGMLNDVKNILKQYAEHTNKKIIININDLRNKTILNNKLNIMPNELLNNVKLRDYQVNAVHSFLVNNGFGMINACTGAGKTVMTAEIIRRLDTTTLWIINQKELLYQTKESFEKVLGIDIGIIGNGIEELKPITLATIQTLHKRVKDMNTKIINYLSNVNFAITDEAHNIAVDMYEQVFKCLVNTKYRLGTTGTSFREDKQDKRMYALVGNVISEITAEELISKGFLVNPTINFYKLKEKIELPKPNLNLMSVEEKLNISKNQYNMEYEVGIVSNTNRNNIIKELCVPKQKILIIVKTIEHGNLLNRIIDNSYFIHGSLNKKDREEYFNILKKSTECIIIATIKIASEGLDVPDLNMLINASGNKSDNRSIQALGRILRTHITKSSATYIDFLDDLKYCKKHSWKRYKVLKDQGYKINIIQK